jgi:aryl-alcohol dehydrogenase-like predicted oxidoreductase
MKTLPLGRSGVDVSALCLGTMMFGTRTDEETSRGLLDRYVEAGGSFIDTANVYAHWMPDAAGGESEMLLGRWMDERGNRNQLFLATKVGFGYPGTDESPGTEDGLSAEQIETECEKSLERLGVDHIDLYYAHHDHRATPLEESFGAFEKLAKAGKVRFIAASNFKAWRLAEALMTSGASGWAEFVAAQQKHTYLRPRRGRDYRLWPPANDDLIDACGSRDVRLVAYSPLVKGAYTRDDKDLPDFYKTAENEARLKALRSVAEETGATANQIVLAWMIQSEPAVVPLFSVSRMEQLEENLGAVEVELTAEQMEQLDTATA